MPNLERADHRLMRIPVKIPMETRISSTKASIVFIQIQYLTILATLASRFIQNLYDVGLHLGEIRL
jgi:hypothetical protein